MFPPNHSREMRRENSNQVATQIKENGRKETCKQKNQKELKFIIILLETICENKCKESIKTLHENVEGCLSNHRVRSTYDIKYRIHVRRDWLGQLNKG